MKRQQGGATTRASVDSSTSERALIPLLNLTTASRKSGLEMALNPMGAEGRSGPARSKKLYVVHEGAIYEPKRAIGRTCHGCPCKGKLLAAWISGHFSMLSPRTDEMLAAVG